MPFRTLSYDQAQPTSGYTADGGVQWQGAFTDGFAEQLFWIFAHDH
jgi:hypothetical protein